MLIFEDYEIEQMIENTNSLQLFYHHIYAVDGRITYRAIMELQRKETTIIVDNNLLSPICECIKTGKTKDKFRLFKIANLITFSKFIHARLTCGLCLIENDTSQKDRRAAEEKRQMFLYAVDKIPSIVWKSLALEYIEEIPSMFTEGYKYIESSKSYVFNENLHFLMHQAAITKIVLLLRNNAISGFEKFMTFFNWLADNLLITESVISYAVLLFGNVKNIKRPKKFASNDLQQVLDGIKNQAWDIFYLSEWSTFYYSENDNDVYGFATDDNTLKMIIANSIPAGQSRILIDYIFGGAANQKNIDDFYQTKLGGNRKKPFETNELEKGTIIVKKVLQQQLNELEEIIKGK